MDHVVQTNHTIDWEKVQLMMMKEAVWSTRGIKESITVRKTGAHPMNRDGGSHQLVEMYFTLLSDKPPIVASVDSTKDEHSSF